MRVHVNEVLLYVLANRTAFTVDDLDAWYICKVLV